MSLLNSFLHRSIKYADKLNYHRTVQDTPSYILFYDIITLIFIHTLSVQWVHSTHFHCALSNPELFHSKSDRRIHIQSKLFGRRDKSPAWLTRPRPLGCRRVWPARPLSCSHASPTQRMDCVYYLNAMTLGMALPSCIDVAHHQLESHSKTFQPCRQVHRRKDCSIQVTV